MNELLRTHGPPLPLLAEKMDLSLPADPRGQCAASLVWVGVLLLPAWGSPFARIPQPEAQRFVRLHQTALVVGYFAATAPLLSPLALRRSRALRIPVCSYVGAGGDALFGNDLQAPAEILHAFRLKAPWEAIALRQACSDAAIRLASVQTRKLNSLAPSIGALRLGTGSEQVERAKNETVADVLTPWLRRFNRMRWRVWTPHCGRCWNRPRGAHRG